MLDSANKRMKRISDVFFTRVSDGWMAEAEATELRKHVSALHADQAIRAVRERKLWAKLKNYRRHIKALDRAHRLLVKETRP